MEHLPFQFIVTSRGGVKKAVKKFGPTHILSTLDPGVRVFKTPRMLQTDHLEMRFEDYENPDALYAPKREHVAGILEWGRRLSADSRLLVHCEAGVSRSSAAALLLLVQASGGDRVQEMMDAVVAVRPQARPNRLMVQYGAEILGCPVLNDIAWEVERSYGERMFARGWIPS